MSRLDDESTRLSAELRDELAANDVRRAVDPRYVPVRFSRLRQLARSALHYWHACQEFDNDSAAKKLGRGVHAKVLNQPVAIWDGVTDSGRARPRNGKDWEAFKAANAGAEILNGKENAAAEAINQAVRRHPRAAELLYAAGTQHELQVDWTFEGRRCSSRLDAYRRGGVLLDLKGARDGDPVRFARTAYWSHYHAQLAFYRAAVVSLGHPAPACYLLVVENVAPHPVTVMPVAERALEAGLALCSTWMERLRGFEAANQWPGYAQADVLFDLPDDGMGAFFASEDVDP
jgi:hypothetical protein